MSLKTSGSEKVSYSKSSCLRLIFWNQLFKNSVSGITLNNDKYGRKNSYSITVHSYFRTQLTLLISGLCRSAHLSFTSRYLLKNQTITLRLANFYFYKTVCRQKNIWRNLTVSHYFRPVAKIGPKQRKTLVTIK